MIHREKYDLHCIYGHIYTPVNALVCRMFCNAFTKIKSVTSLYNPILSKNHFLKTTCLSLGSYIHL